MYKLYGFGNSSEITWFHKTLATIFIFLKIEHGMKVSSRNLGIEMYGFKDLETKGFKRDFLGWGSG